MKAMLARWLGVPAAMEAAATAAVAAEGSSATALQAIELCHRVLDKLAAVEASGAERAIAASAEIASLRSERASEIEQGVQSIASMRDACMKASADAIAAALRCLEAERGRQAMSRPVDDDLEDALDRLGERRR